MHTVSIQNLALLDVPDTYRMITPDGQPGTQPTGVIWLLALMGIGGRRHIRHVVVGPEDAHLEFHAWKLNDSFTIPPMKERPMLNNDYGYGPIGGAIRERGTIVWQGVEHAWIIREAPDDVTWDEVEQRVTKMPFSFDVEAIFPNRLLVKAQCRLESADSPLIDTYRELLSTLRPCSNRS